jgi:hypothetical protein
VQYRLLKRELGYNQKMKIIGAENMTNQQLAEEIRRGAKCIMYEYCLSIVIMTFRRPSGIYLILPSESAVVKGLGFSAISFFLGWWGFPWGIIYTIGSFITNFRGGTDLTMEVMADLEAYPQSYSSPAQR